MAEITLKSNAQKRGTVNKNRHVHSTRVDLTPMVDLGFLLITFFIFTTTMSQPKAMRLIIPDDKGDPMNIKESGALTLLPASNGLVYYYEGKFETAQFKETDLKEMRNLIINKKARTKEKDFFVVIKPADLSTYGDVVKVLDEMKIDDVKRYSLADISKTERALIK
ncbi:MAG: biopolymer transporter ExbD [Chitinophagaceae bacterium]|nr:biopolymer transporter ExbD [Chitinophagaceae bacterium]